MTIKSDGIADSTCFKVTWSGGSYLQTLYHQISKGAVIHHNGSTYAVPKYSDDVYIRPFAETEICLLPWGYFKGLCPIVSYWALSADVSGDGGLTYCGLDPDNKSFVFSGLAEQVVDQTRLRYGNSTGNGSCGAGIFTVRGGQVYLVGVHGGTYGSGRAMNYAYRFVMKSKN